MQHSVFLSYSYVDLGKAETICDRLESSGFPCWMAPRDIAPGSDWGEEIINAISASEVMVLLLSSSSNESQQVLREVERAVHKRIRIIPVRIEELQLSKNMEYFISSAHWLNAESGNIEEVLDLIEHSVGMTIQPQKKLQEETELPATIQSNAQEAESPKTTVKRRKRKFQFSIFKKRRRMVLVATTLALLVGIGVIGMNWVDSVLNEHKTRAQEIYIAGSTAHKRAREQNDTNGMKRAESLYNQALDLFPDHIGARRNLAVLLVDTNRPDRAFALLKEWIRSSPDLADPYIELARLHGEFGDQSYEYDLLLDALDCEFENSRTIEALGHLQTQSGSPESVFPTYEGKRDPYECGDPEMIATGDLVVANSQLLIGETPAIHPASSSAFPTQIR